tara:strand:- start:6296 stop:6802 length:507 start_codon:yes stop_codon:yes gene_type:complete
MSLYDIVENLDNYDYQDDIIVKSIERFYPMLSRDKIDTLDYLFCVDSINNTKIFAQGTRYIRITKKYRDKFNLKKGYIVEDINKVLNGVNVLIVKRDIINGIKQDDKYIIAEGKFSEIVSNLSDITLKNSNLMYQYVNINVKINNKNEIISPDRVFIDKNNRLSKIDE